MTVDEVFEGIGIGFTTIVALIVMSVLAAMLSNGCKTFNEIESIDGNGSAIWMNPTLTDDYMVCVGGTYQQPTHCHQLGALRKLPLRSFR